MTDTEISELRSRLSSFVVPQTERPLGEAGTRFEVARSGNVIDVTVHVSFPVDISRDRLREALLAHCAATGLPLRFEIDWSVATQAVQRGLKPLPGIGNLVAVASGKGGVGKSTVAVNLALALAAEGARVGILDADIYGPSQPRLLGLIGAKPQTKDGKTLDPLTAHGLKTMSIGFLVDESQPMAWRGPMVTSALNQLLSQTNWGELDYLIIDMPPGTGDIQLTLAQKVPVSGAIIVTTPQEVALSDARKGLEMFQKVSVPILGVVENMSVHVCSNCGHEEPVFGSGGGAKLAGEYGLPLLGKLPLQNDIREHSDSGVPIVAAEPGGAAAGFFFAAAGRAAGELAAGDKDYSQLFPKITVED